MTFDVELAGPLDLSLSLNGFQRFGDDMIDRWDGTTLVRTATVAGRRVAYTGRSIGTIEQPFLRVTVEDAGAERAVEEEIRGTFLLPPPEWEDLLRDDPVLARLDTRFPGLRPVLQPDLLTALVRSISAQQVNLRWAATTRRRLAERFGERHEVAGWEVYAFEPARLAAAPPEEIRAMQFTTRKAEYIVGAAAAVA